MQMPDFSSTPADAAARLVAFMNSHGVAQHDALADASDAASDEVVKHARDCAALGYPGVPFPCAQALQMARAVRTLLLEGTGGAGMAGSAALNDIAADLPWVYRFGADGAATPVPVHATLAAWVVRDLALVTAAGQWTRIKTCANAACGALFHDTTRAGNGRWHSFELCGNRANVAAHRRRQSAPDT
jgi:predicted RNA-binding Zn ribbon-like protein